VIERREIQFGQAWSGSLRRGSPGELEGWLRFGLDLADVVDGMARDAFQGALRIDTKPDGSFVTDADRAIEELVRDRVRRAYPAHRIHGEEFGDDGPADVRWYVDPIDGTHNFMRGIPLFGFLLAVERDGEIQVGVISAPALRQRWFAQRGGGAFTVDTLGGPHPRPIGVSSLASLDRAQVLYRSIGDMRGSRVADGFERIIREAWRERGFGDFWGYTLVSGGHAEAMMERDLGPWDLAAPWILVEEAGGSITDFDGVRSLARGEGLATNGHIHRTVLDRLRDRAG
jgi:histidinol-phosphatase